VAYLVEAADEARRTWTPARIAEIAEEIRRTGYWQETVEWRISTETTSRIEIDPYKHGRRWFKVTVRCDSEIVCHAPTLERAVEFMGLHQRLIMDEFYTLGWASWAARNRPEPEPRETTP